MGPSHHCSTNVQNQFKGIFGWLVLNKQLGSWEKTQCLNWEHPKSTGTILGPAHRADAGFGGQGNPSLQTPQAELR